MAAKITRKQFDEARALLRRDKLHERLTYRDVATRSGVSETTARDIDHGRVRRPPAQRKPTKPRLHDGVEFVIVEPYKCPGCHLNVILRPCLICHERAKRDRKF